MIHETCYVCDEAVEGEVYETFYDNDGYLINVVIFDCNCGNRWQDEISEESLIKFRDEYED